MAELALPRPASLRPLPFGLALAALGLGLFALVLLRRPDMPGASFDLDALLLWHSLLPRAATALLAGAALGLSGALLQRVLRNPIADPSTLGIAAGAQLALTLALAFAPALLAFSREGTAFAGGVVAVALVLALSARRGFEPVTLVVAGMTLSLMAGALSAALILARGDYVFALFIWGAGSLHQQNWEPALVIGTRLALAAGATFLLRRPLGLMALDDAGARSLGMAVQGMRLAVIAVAVALAASVVSEVGVIGFVGLAAPALARVAGARRPDAVLLAAPLIGALLLWITDSLVQLTAGSGGDLIPTGAAVGLLGGPLLLWLLPRLRATAPPLTAPATPRRRWRHPRRVLAGLAVAALLVGLFALVAGRDLEGWALATGPLLTELLAFRAPRVVAAAAAGGLLGAAGAIMQKLTGNPLAGPEVLGVSAGAGVGLAAALMLVPEAGPGLLLAASAGGALGALLLVLAIAAATGFGAEKLLLAGIALGCMALAILSAVFAAGGPGSFLLLAWLAGTTDRVDLMQAGILAACALVLLLPVALAGRWLALLPLGAGVAGSLGLRVAASQLLLTLLAAAMTGVAAFFVGPLSLVGLIGPHLARQLGLNRGALFVFASALIGALVLLLADWLARMVAFPYQLPTGLLAALVGGPYLIWLLQRGDRHG
ncbi:Fe(3+)-hydroxamate ABC transporter permease FhuB [Ancylobacter polymorphus]|uniref:Fe(3+)-hydroxamate ABC transporter permease FhuB n=1 Tax=Ancylobacter polymorphus TaxID=223390 RepID=A0A9E7CX50_9HYPH|nr:Fe(3+)-hydroxamate ABC transporter permease FhuB [Ancylobacter polymorphus]UOK71919.1 Fe(3+)-hydroxamate ABC transporter permease FhuB [Ancylobacter polymorphus]